MVTYQEDLFVICLLKMQYSIVEFKINYINLTKMTYTPYQAGRSIQY